MNNCNDLRVRRTRMYIRNAFFHLLTEQPFEKIQINDITARAMINRSTFYLHYRDKCDLVRQLREEQLAIIDGYMASLTAGDVLRCQEGEVLPQFLALLSDIQQMPELFRMMAQPDSGFYEHITRTLQQKLGELFPEHAVPDVYGERIFCAVLRCVIETWMARDFQDDTRQLALLLTQELLLREKIGHERI